MGVANSYVPDVNDYSVMGLDRGLSMFIECPQNLQAYIKRASDLSWVEGGLKILGAHPLKIFNLQTSKLNILKLSSIFLSCRG